MKVVLIKDVKGVGRMHEEKEVSEGYAINFLIPKKLAVPAAGAAASEVKNLKEMDAKHKEAELKKLEAEVHKLSERKLEFKAKVNEKGNLFFALDAKKIHEILNKEGVHIPSELILLENKIKEVGTHKIEVRVGDKRAHFNLEVASD
jgi:large subunit ribosomal protein L9